MSVEVLCEWMSGSVLASPWVPEDTVRASDGLLSRLMMASCWNELLETPNWGLFRVQCLSSAKQVLRASQASSNVTFTPVINTFLHILEIKTKVIASYSHSYNVTELIKVH